MIKSLCEIHQTVEKSEKRSRTDMITICVTDSLKGPNKKHNVSFLSPSSIKSGFTADLQENESITAMDNL